MNSRENVTAERPTSVTQLKCIGTGTRYQPDRLLEQVLLFNCGSGLK